MSPTTKIRGMTNDLLLNISVEVLYLADNSRDRNPTLPILPVRSDRNVFDGLVVLVVHADVKDGFVGMTIQHSTRSVKRRLRTYKVVPCQKCDVHTCIIC